MGCLNGLDHGVRNVVILNYSFSRRISDLMSCYRVLKSIVEDTVMLSCVHITEMESLLGAEGSTHTFQQGSHRDPSYCNNVTSH